jgi:hypothetical protein
MNLKNIAYIFILSVVGMATFASLSPVQACLATNPKNVSCNQSYYKGVNYIDVKVTETAELKLWLNGNQWTNKITVKDGATVLGTVTWQGKAAGATAWDTRTITVPAGGSKTIRYEFQVCIGGNLSNCQNWYGWMPASLGEYRNQCGTGCQCSGQPGLYYAMSGQGSLITAATADGAKLYDLRTGGATLFNDGSRQANSGDVALSCWNDNMGGTGDQADFNDMTALWTLKTAAVQQTAPTVTTSDVSGVTATTAVGGGNVTTDGGSPILERGIVFSKTNHTPTVSDTKVAITGTTGSMTGNMTGLSASTTYYVRAFARNAIGTSYGAVVTFATTNGSIEAPTVITKSPATNIGATSFTIAGDVTDDGGTEVTERGFVYSATKTLPNLSDSGKRVLAGGVGAYSAYISGLSPRTKYYVRAYAKNAAGTGYGAVVEVTSALAVPTHTPTETGFGDDNFFLYLGGILYLMGIAMFVGSKSLAKKRLVVAR